MPTLSPFVAFYFLLPVSLAQLSKRREIKKKMGKTSVPWGLQGAAQRNRARATFFLVERGRGRGGRVVELVKLLFCCCCWNAFPQVPACRSFAAASCASFISFCRLLRRDNISLIRCGDLEEELRWRIPEMMPASSLWVRKEKGNENFGLFIRQKKMCGLERWWMNRI